MKSKSYFIVILCSLIIGTCAHALEAKNLEREKDLKVILEQTFLNGDKFDKVAAMYVSQRISLGEYDIPVESIIKRLRQAMQTQEALKQLMEPYRAFSDEEIHQLREIFENVAFLKYTEQSLPISKFNMQVMDNVLSAILHQGFEIEMPVQTHMFESDQVDSEILKITKDNFHEEVEEESTKPMIIDVYADWCRPCHVFAATFKEFHQKYQDKCRFGKVNSQEESMLINFLKVKAYPTTVFIYKGKVVKREVGNMSREKFEAKMQEFLKEIE